MISNDHIADELSRIPETDLRVVLDSTVLVGKDAGTGALSWEVERLQTQSIGNGTLGLWRVQGVIGEEDRAIKWSFIVKAVDPAAPVVIGGFNHAWRELEALRSGQLESLGSGLRPVPVFAIQDKPDGTAWMWLKDLSKGEEPPWSSDSFLSAARHVGQFNGLLVESDVQLGEWVATDGSTDRRASAFDAYAQTFRSLGALDDDHRFTEASELVGKSRVLSLLDNLRTLVRSTESIERSVAHNDCHSRNLFPIDLRTTYAIDWASVGMAPIGIDGGGLAGASFTWSRHEAEVIEKIESKIFDNYILGLRDTGWNGDESSVRLAYLSTFASYVVHLVFMLNSFITDGPFAAHQRRRIGIPNDEVYEEIGRRFERFVPFVDEALQLAK